jgi:ribose transport system substrate-binding protein
LHRGSTHGCKTTGSAASLYRNSDVKGEIMKKLTLFLLLAAVVFSGLFTQIFSQEKLTIAVVPKTKIGAFWQAVLAGAKLGSVALGNVEVVWRVPAEYATWPQVSAVEQSIAEGVSGIILAPLEKDSLAVPVAKAMKKKIPVLIFDSALKGTAGKDYISFVGIDNKKAGALAGERLAQLLGGKGKVAMLRVAANQVSILEREKGFLEVMAKYNGIQLIETDRYAGAGLDNAMNESLKMADRLKEADGIFCSYEQTTSGMLLALQKIGLAGKVKFIGFDTPAAAVEALKRGEISALIAQDPARMGYLSVKAIVDYLRGKKIDPTIDTGVQMVTRENLESPEIQKILALPVVEE